MKKSINVIKNNRNIKILLFCFIIIIAVICCKSTNVITEGKIPEITKCEWLDIEGKETDKNVLFREVKLSVITKNIKNGKTVTFKIYAISADTEKDEPLITLSGKVKNNKAEVAFNFKEFQMKPIIDEVMYRYYIRIGRDVDRKDFEYFPDDTHIKEKPKYFYTANVKGIKEAKSGEIEVSKTFTFKYSDWLNKPVKGIKVTITENDGTEYVAFTDEEGKAVFTDLIPATTHYRYEMPEGYTK